MIVPFLDVGASYTSIKEEIDVALARVALGGWYTSGPEVTAFETAFAVYCETQHAAGVGNGLDAITLSLRALGIGKGDDVLVPSHTFIATWLAVTQTGARVIPVEAEEDHYTITAVACEAALTERTKAVIPVHLYGHPADMDPILAMAKVRGLAVIEDAAQAHGALYKGQRVGGLGDITTWSFYPGKNLGAMGDGGAVTTNRKDLFDQVKLISNYGSSEKYVHTIAGTNSRLDPLQAAVLQVKLGHLDAWNRRRQQIAAKYSDAFADTDLILPATANWADPVWHLYVVRSKTRDKLAEHLSQCGIQTLVHYPIPPHQQGAYRDLGFKSGQFPIAESLAKEVLSLPIGPHLSERDQETVIAAVLKAV